MKAIAYLRVSTSNQDLHRQSDKIIEYCSGHNHTLIRTIEDFGISGASKERAGYNELLSLTSGDCDLLIVSEQSRLSRQEDIIEVVGSIQSIVMKGISIVFLDNPDTIYEGGKPLDFTNILILLIGAWKASQERIKDKEKMQDGKNSALLINPYAVVDASVPFGFVAVPNPNGNVPKKILQTVDEEVVIIKRVYSCAIDGLTLGQIASMLNSEGIKIGKHYITTQRISTLLKSTIYKGERTRISKYKGGEPKVTTVYINPIISPEDWLLAQNKIKDNYTNVSNGAIFNPLKGILRCRCGRSMTLINKKYPNNRYRLIYRCCCALRKNNPLVCSFGKDEVSAQFTARVIKEFVKKITTTNLNMLLKSVEEKTNEILNEIKIIEHAISKSNSLITKFQEESELNLNKILSATTATVISILEKNQLAIEEKINKEKNKISKHQSDILGKRELIKKLTSKKVDIDSLEEEELSELYHNLIATINYTPSNKLIGCYTITLISGATYYIIVDKSIRCTAYILPPKWYLSDTSVIGVYEEQHSLTKFSLCDSRIIKEYSMKDVLCTGEQLF